MLRKGEEGMVAGGRKEISPGPAAGGGSLRSLVGQAEVGSSSWVTQWWRLKAELCLIKTLTDTTTIMIIIFSLVKHKSRLRRLLSQEPKYIIHCN